MSDEDLHLLLSRIGADNVAGASELLNRHAEQIRAILTGEQGSGQVAGLLRQLCSAEMAELLFRHGLSVEAIGRAWAPGFGLDGILPHVAAHLVDRGLELTAHSAAGLGLVGKLREILERHPDAIHLKGGDGCRPLHFSRNLETVNLLLDAGAEIDARDDDHNSTAAQWRIREAPEVTRLLLERGARPDIFMAAAFGDIELAGRLLDQDPLCPTHRIGNNRGPFPGIGFTGRGPGGTIYQWTLGFNLSPHEVAMRRGHREFFGFLWSRTPPRQQLLVACMLADRPRAMELLSRLPGLVAELDEEDRALLAKSCWETNLNLEAVKLMVDVGFPVDAPEFNHGFQPLHNAAWCGDAALVELLLQRRHPVGVRDPVHRSTALGFAIHSCVVAKRHPGGDFPRVVRLLLEAGTPIDPNHFPSGNAGIDAVIAEFRARPVV